jgi:hypothetical protein
VRVCRATFVCFLMHGGSLLIHPSISCVLGGPPLEDEQWHIKDYYDNIRKKVLNLDKSLGNCYQIEGKLPTRMCNTPMKVSMVLLHIFRLIFAATDHRFDSHCVAPRRALNTRRELTLRRRALRALSSRPPTGMFRRTRRNLFTMVRTHTTLALTSPREKLTCLILFQEEDAWTRWKLGRLTIITKVNRFRSLHLWLQIEVSKPVLFPEKGGKYGRSRRDIVMGPTMLFVDYLQITNAPCTATTMSKYDISSVERSVSFSES